MTQFKDLRTCPRCQGSTFSPDGKDCWVCGAVGVISLSGDTITYEEGEQYLDWLQETNQRKGFRYG